MSIRDRLRVLLYGPDPEPGEMFERRRENPFRPRDIVLIEDVRGGWVKYSHVWNSSRRPPSASYTLAIPEFYAAGYKTRVESKEEDDE
jgi:hypothetical protein